ncbi:MAG: ATP adenyltransferase, partial [Streblomastix strix]
MILRRLIQEREHAAIQKNAVFQLNLRTFQDMEGKYSFNIRMPLNVHNTIAWRQRKQKTITFSNQQTSKDIEVKQKPDPFDPPDPELFICSLFETHNVIINKFMMAPRHLVIPTIKFEGQQMHLSLADIRIAEYLLRELGG